MNFKIINNGFIAYFSISLKVLNTEIFFSYTYTSTVSKDPSMHSIQHRARCGRKDRFIHFRISISTKENVIESVEIRTPMDNFFFRASNSCTIRTSIKS